jgi:hypothetical protein
MSVSIDKYIDFTQIINNDYRILYFDLKVSSPSPLQWKFFINEFSENLDYFKHLQCKFALVMDVKLIGLLSTDYVLEFIKLLVSNRELLESKLIATSVIYEGSLINKLFEILKIFYKTKKPIEFVPNMIKAVEFIDSNN